MWTVLFFSSICQMCILLSEAALVLNNVNCAPHADYIETDPNNHRYYPYVVKLHRCKGSWENFSLFDRKCIAVQTEQLPVSVTRIDYGNTIYRSTIQLINHTQCLGVCAQGSHFCSEYQVWSNKTCRCHCKFERNADYSPCKNGKVWNPFHCTCQCLSGSRDCGTWKMWSEEKCGCVCKPQACAGFLDPDTCHCMAMAQSGFKKPDTEGIPKSLLIYALVVEALAIILLFFIFYLCLFKRFCKRRRRREEQLRRDSLMVRRNSVLWRKHSGYEREQSRQCQCGQSNSLQSGSLQLSLVQSTPLQSCAIQSPSRHCEEPPDSEKV